MSPLKRYLILVTLLTACLTVSLTEQQNIDTRNKKPFAAQNDYKISQICKHVARQARTALIPAP